MSTGSSFVSKDIFMRFICTLLGVFTLLAHSAQIKLPTLDRVSEEHFNFVPDPGFEEATKAPCKWNQGLGKFDKWMVKWTCPTETTPDLLSTKADRDCWAHPRKHSEGKQGPHSGCNMVGIKIYGTGGSDTYWHEYVQVELKEPLKKDSLYYAHVWVNLSRKASKATNNIGIVLKEEETKTHTRHPLYITPLINADQIIKPKILGWKKVSGVFKAKGGERFLMIGNFYGDEQTTMTRLDRGKDGAYYYIDDVMLRKALPHESPTAAPKESSPPPPLVEVEERSTTSNVEINEVAYKVGTTIELENVYFDFDKSEILPKSRQELDELADLLFDYPHMSVEIGGHTDDKGTADYNLRLSETRAQAVVAYLIHKGVKKDRLTFKGYGSRIPIADNTTEEGQAQNRRVEFKIKEI